MRLGRNIPVTNGKELSATVNNELMHSTLIRLLEKRKGKITATERQRITV
jgi:hypothetical protein